jgi:choline dehydrogenase-like flavoprotein
VKNAIVVGSGAGGATMARALQGAFAVTVLEAGGEFKPFAMNLKIPERFKRAGLLFDAREISMLFPAMKIDKAGDRMIHVRGIGTGGTTTIAAGNALRLDDDFRKAGIDLDESFAELAGEIPITVDHRPLWRPPTRRFFEICREMGMDPQPTPKMGRQNQCRNCGRCVLGCPYGVKWDSRAFLDEARAKGARLVVKTRVERVVIRGGEAQGVVVRRGWRRRFIPADVVILAAGGLGTPVILSNSGLAGRPRLFVDPVLCVAAPYPGARQNAELSMPFYVQREGYILSPYFDHLSYYFNRAWKPPAGDILSLMIKLADSNEGSVDRRGLHKTLTARDKGVLSEAVDLCRDIFGRFGVPKEKLFLGTLNAGHPGGMFPLTPAEARTLHHESLPANVYIADASLYPASLGRPPILTIMALAKSIARRIIAAA